MRAVILAVVLGGCRITGTFECATAEQCIGPGGTAGACISGSCAYLDEDCTAGYRFAESAAEEVAGVCLETVPPVGCAEWMPRHFTPCDLPSPLGPIVITSARTYDTDLGEFDVPIAHTSTIVAQTTGGMVRVISVSSLTVDTSILLRVTGSLPLVIAAWDSIQILGRIEANSVRGAEIGAGANPTGCLPAMPGGAAIERGAGGGGGGFQGAGGDGGLGGNPMVAMGGKGGLAAPMATLAASVRGGCPGAASGAAGPGAVAPATATSVGTPGAGGGALQLTARRSIAITGRLNVGGAGGHGAPMASSAGGGGGGAGGYLGLEAPAISVSGGLAANGGGGGGGGAVTTSGGDGNDAGFGTTAARGGIGGGPAGGCSGEGSTGAAGAALAGGDANNNARVCGGGGGGGGAGVIAVRSAAYVAAQAASISPPVVIDPP